MVNMLLSAMLHLLNKIAAFHIFMAPAGLPLAVVVTVLWFLAASSVRSAFTGILER